MAGLSDFNDLHVTEGLDAVRDQVMACLAAPAVVPAPQSEEGPAPLDDAPPLGDDAAPADDSPDLTVIEARITLEQALERFALAMPDAKCWDTREQKLLKPVAARALLGKSLYAEWLEHEQRRTVQQADVNRAAAAAKTEGEGEMQRALQRYVYLDGTEQVWDCARREILPMGVVRYAIAACFTEWNKHPMRRVLPRERLVFDPQQKQDPATHINMFRGLPMVPDASAGGCENLKAVVWHLCNGRADVFDWLTKWLAWPLQHVGSKMATAILMHSETQGSGKSLIFGGVMRAIYGEYGATLGQHQLESQYTDWSSQKLFGLFEEVFSRDQKYSHTGTLKHMITGETHRIEKKFVSGWEEANFLNAVFLSNEIQPFPVEPSDRRMMVIWPSMKLDPGLQADAVAELDSGGIQAFYAWLLSIDLTGFGPHEKPPMTPEKQRIIDFGRPGWEVFYDEWQRGQLTVPYISCTTAAVYAAFKTWCRVAGERDMPRNKLINLISTRETVKQDVRYWKGGGIEAKSAFLVIGEAPEGKTQKTWLSECAQQFNTALEADRDF